MMALHYYPRYAKDFLDSTAGWELKEKGAFAVLLDLIYKHDGELPDRPRYIAGNLGCTVRTWGLVRAKLLEMGKIETRLSKDNQPIITNSRADRETEKLKHYLEKQSQNGSKAHKNKGIAKASAGSRAEAMGLANDSPAHQTVRASSNSDSDKEEEGAGEADFSKQEEPPNPEASQPATAPEPDASQPLAPGLLADIRQAVGIQAHQISAYWSDDALSHHVRAWIGLGLSEATIIAEAKASRSRNPDPPDGPKALDRWMQTAAKARSTDLPRPGTQSAPATAKATPTPEERLKFYADWVNDDARHLPQSAISTSLAQSLLHAQLVTLVQLRKRGIAA